MRLLNSRTFELEEFPNHEDVSYAILSHTWGDEEVLFQDIEGLDVALTPDRVKEKLGYKKIEACCAQAVHDGFDYVWIDTCCIDKRSSAELSEAINSMYRWYSDCTVCYAYLADVPNNVDAKTQKEKFQQSMWFTRGWTLQELIGPLNLEFYGDQWQSQRQQASLGTKRSLWKEIFEITGIPPNALQHNSHLIEYSIAQKMSWAAYRKTTRKEDRAYSLLGLFNVNMALLYGEGDRAFIRLQEAIMKDSGDETLFAWKREEKRQDIIFEGLLAMSPDWFGGSGNIIEKIHNQRSKPFMVTNKGLHLEVMLRNASEIREARTYQSEDDRLNLVCVAVLNASKDGSENSIGIILGRVKERSQANSSGDFVRLNSEGLLLISPTSHKPSESDHTTIFARLAASSDPDEKQVSSIWRYFTQEYQYRSVWLKVALKEFRLAESWPNGKWIETKEGMEFPELRAEDSRIISSTVLRFDDGLHSFIVGFRYHWGDVGLYVENWQSGESLGENFDPLKFWGNSIRDTGDRLNHTLSFGASLSVSLRPQRIEQRPVYFLYISI